MSKMDEIYELYKNVKIELNEHKADEETKNKWDCYNTIIQKLQERTAENDDTNDETRMKLLTMLSAVYYEQARLFITKNDPRASENLKISFQTIQERKSNPGITYIYLRIINLYSYLQAKNGNLQEAKELLLDAEELYNDIVDKNEIIVFNTDELFKPTSISSPNVGKLEKLVTNNLQMLGWIYNKQNLLDTFVVYHHTVLRRQLEQQDGNALHWVMKCGRLSSYFLSKQRFCEARHHLSAALVVLQEYEKELSENKNDPKFVEEWEEYQHYYADVARYWVKYGLFLFCASRSQKMKNLIDKQVDDKNREKGDENVAQSDDNEKSGRLLLFPTINVTHIEKEVTDELITSGEEARSLFNHAQTWLKRSKQFYTVQNHTLDYVNSILDLSELYRYLAYYEEDLENQYDVQKHRVDALETLSTVLKDVRPQCYVAVSIELIRELAEVQMELLGLNMKKLYKMDANGVVEHVSIVRDYNIRKMEAISDIHTRLESFNDKVIFK